MAHLLGAENISLEYPTKVVFGDGRGTGVTLGIEEGDRIGVVGRNGDGKSSLLRLLAGRQQPDAGRVTRRGGVTIGMLDQSDELPAGATVAELVVDGRAEHEWAGDARVRDVIAGLIGGTTIGGATTGGATTGGATTGGAATSAGRGGSIPWNAPVESLSGGQRRRVALAALLTHDWDIVFLDEPTNHLDLEGVAWLAGHLRQRWPANQGGLVVVTHDRWFLDEVSTATWEVHDGIVEPFEGGYAAYILQRVERDRQAAASESRRQNLLRKELAWLRRGAPARSTKPKFRMDAAAALIENEPPVRDSVRLSQLSVARLGKDVVDLLDTSVAFDGVEVLHPLEWRIAPGERTGILGVNGAGKSTLLGLIAGTVEPTSGRVKRGKTVTIAVLDQRLADLDDIAHLRVSAVIADQRAAYVSGGVELSPGQLLERLGFSSAQLSTPVKDLSGGQKRRLQLLLILLQEPNVLILDEPTNDLDTDMLAAMEDLLDSWPGTLLVVSHDRYLIERVTDQQYAILGGHLRHLPGGVEEYLKLSAGRGARQAGVSGPGAGGFETRPPAAGAPQPAAAGAPQSAAGAPQPAQLAGSARRDAEKELAATDRRLAKLAESIRNMHERFAAHDQDDYVGLGALQGELSGLETEAAALEERWLELSSLLEG